MLPRRAADYHVIKICHNAFNDMSCCYTVQVMKKLAGFCIFWVMLAVTGCMDIDPPGT
ncbi:MAG: hypothetical protein GY854_16170 [Deltaproteobacteria bacterium]|nr:hypothetical protein [Deltaproteobacteria bacterium]